MIQERVLPILDLPDSLTSDSTAGFGALETSRGCLPLVAMDVTSDVSGLWSRTRITQTYCNTTDGPIEATYIFPLPDRAAVHSCVLYIGERRVESELKERAAARAEYDEAIATGHRAAIAEEDRSGVFSLRAGNIPSGESVRVEFEMVGPLEIDSGEATVRFPLVVAPRYVPGSKLEGLSVGLGTVSDTDEVPDASRVTPPVLLPGFPNPVDLSLSVTIDPAGLEPSPGAWRDQLRCTLHSVVTESGSPWTVRLRPGERLDRDFVLRFPVTSAQTAGTLQVSPATETRSGTLAVTLIPDDLGPDATSKPRDVVVLVDRSGSMHGWKMVAARRAAGRLIDSLGDDDRFGVIAFDHEVETQVEGLQSASDRNRFRAVSWMSNLESCGGTEMGEPLELAARWLAEASEAADRDPIIVLVTDGQVAGEDMLLRQLQDASGPRMPRVFSVGIDQAVNAGFLRRLSDLGGGLCELVESEDRLDEVMDRIACRLRPPRLSELSIESDGIEWDAESLVPGRLPDLFAGRPVTILARHSSRDLLKGLVIRARRPDGSSWESRLEAIAGDESMLVSAWGRQRVRELEDRVASGAIGDVEELQREIVRVSLESGVLSRYTAFVAVDEAETIDSQAPPQQIVQPVEMAAGWLASAMPKRAVGMHVMSSHSMAEDVDMMQCDYKVQPSYLEAPSAGPVDVGRFLEAVEVLEELSWMQPIEEPVPALAAFAKLLKRLRRLARRRNHSGVVLIERLYDDTVAYLKWLRRPKGRPGPFATIEEWIERAELVLRELAGVGDPDDSGDVGDVGPRDAFWASHAS